MIKDFSIIIPTIRLDLAKEAQQSMLPFESVIKFSETKAESFSKLINECIVSTNVECIIICSDKGRPTPQDIGKMLDLISQGYGIVGLYRFGFFGFKKELIRKIGFFDERYIGGGFEDWDMIKRLKEANIAYFEDDNIKFINNLSSTWCYENNFYSCPSAIHLKNKWNDDFSHQAERTKRFMAEEVYNYIIGPSTGDNFLPWSKSVLCSWRQYI